MTFIFKGNHPKVSLLKDGLTLPLHFFAVVVSWVTNQIVKELR